MKVTIERRVLSAITILALMLSLFAWTAVTAPMAYADTPDVWDGTIPAANAAYAFSGGSGTANDPYLVGSAADLAQLAANVNAGTAYSGVYFQQTVDIDLDGNSWNPIGGVCGVSGTVPNGNKFSGVFDGYNHNIDNLSVSENATSSSNNTGFGLFGYVNGGTVGNFALSGHVSVGGTAADIGGAVGYTNGSLYNITSSVNITATETSSNVGGVVGSMENTSVSLTAQYLANTGGIILGGGRIGGVIGGIYSGASNKNYVDRCYNTGDVTSAQKSKTFAGGVVGYGNAEISNCYNTGNLTAGGPTVKTNIGGITGILVHYNTPQSSMRNCYSTASFYNWMSGGYAQYLYASADSDSTTPVNDSYWVVPDNGALGYNQAAYGTNTNVAAQLAESALTPALMNAHSTDNAYTSGGADAAAVIDFTDVYIDLQSGTPTPAPETDDLTMIFLDGSATTSGSGSKTSPYNSLTTALGDLTATRDIVYILGEVEISANTTISSAIEGATIMRSGSYTGNLFTVTNGNTLTLGDDPGTTAAEAIIIDGNTNIKNASGSLFWVEGGSLVINTGAVLQNNSTQTAGGAIHLRTGSATLAGGKIINNTAKNGGAVEIDTGAGFTMTSGEISGNTAARLGNGIYDNGTLTLTPASSGTFSVADVIYLTDGKYINVGATIANITGSLTVTMANTAVNQIVAQVTGSYAVFTLPGDLKFAYSGGSHAFKPYNSNKQIALAS
jgi:hypothetical protein